MELKELVAAIARKHQEEGIEIHSPATANEIRAFEAQIGFSLPQDFRELYAICNGFACSEDIFNITPLEEITRLREYGKNWFYFAEYMINSDMWGLRRIAEDQYEIFNGSYPDLILTSSLNEFLERFLQGNVFDPGGLYDWHDEIRAGSV